MKLATMCRSAWAALVCSVVAACGGGGGGGATPTPPATVLQSIAISPASATINTGATQQLQATGSYSDGSTSDLTAKATWTSSATSAATVTGGLVTGVASGSTTITATYAGVSASTKVAIQGNRWASTAAAPFYLSAPPVLLKDGTVLEEGGDPTVSPEAAVFNPATGAWSRTGPTATNRNYGSATLMQDGRVLVAGGMIGSTYLSSAEIYDPTQKTWSLVAPMPGPRQNHAAALLGDGRVLIVGGDDAGTPLPDALIYDPSTNTWTSSTPPLPIDDNPTATVLHDGKILVTYYFGGGNSALFDPATSSWQSGPATLYYHEIGSTATLLSDGRVLLVGGLNYPPPAGVAQPPEIYDPVANTWSAAGTMLNNRVEHVASLLPNGKVFVAGGRNGLNSTASAEIYDPGTNTWSAATDMPQPTSNAGAVTLPSGTVFVVDGNNDGAAQLTAELYWF